jgi:hypothetical protein
MLVHDPHVRVINATTGDLIRELTIDPARNHQPNRPAARPTTKNTPNPIRVQGVLDVLRHHSRWS